MAGRSVTQHGISRVSSMSSMSSMSGLYEGNMGRITRWDLEGNGRSVRTIEVKLHKTSLTEAEGRTGESFVGT